MPRILCLLVTALATAQTRTVTQEEVMRVHNSAPIIDTHNDVPMKTVKGFDITSQGQRGSTDYAKLKAGGVAATFFSAYVPAKHALDKTSAAKATAMIDTIRNDIVRKHPDRFVLVTTADGIEAAHKQGKFAALIGIEGGHAIEDSLDKLRAFYARGVRYMTLTHTNTNNWADSSGGVKRHNGLTAFGKQVVKEMNKLGMIVDISHVSDKTFADVLAVSTAPVMASHSSCRGLVNAPRNMTDAMIAALAAKGGVIQINFACGFLNDRSRIEAPALKKALWTKYDDVDDVREAVEANKTLTRATLADVVAHIDHAVRIGGIQSVGIGSDFDGVECTPVGLEDVSKFPNLTRALLEKGYTAEQIRMIYGGNTLRLMRAVETERASDLIVTARYVVTMDPQRRVIQNGAVVIKADTIEAVGSQADIDETYTALRRIDAGDSVVLPGLINTHTHAPMVLFRGIADDLKLQDWLEKFIFPAEAKNVTPDFVRLGTRLACAEMLLSGTTTYADMYYFEDTIAEATKECGMRAVLGQTVIGFPVPDAQNQTEALARAEAFLKRFADDPLITPAIAPHAVYTVSDDLMKAARALANKYSAPLLIHLSETKKENDDLMAKRKLSPTKLLESLGALTGRTLVAHGIWVDDADLDILRDRKVGVAHCPSSNMKLASGIAPVLKYLKRDIAIGLGTDGAAGSNNDLDMLEEIDLAGKLQKVTSGDSTALNASQALEMATIRGARALGLDKQIGSLEPGKRADLIAIQLSGPHSTPLYDIYSHLASALKGSDVRHAIINGKLVVNNRQVLTLNLPLVLQAAQKFGHKRDPAKKQ